jgi:hypothetical protein
MNENFDWSKFAQNEEVGGDKEDQQGSWRNKGSSSDSAAETRSTEAGGGGSPPKPPICSFAADAAAVMKKANNIALSLNHSERTMAHVIAGIALIPDAAELFNKCRFTSGAIQFGSSAASLTAEQALHACLRYIEESVSSQSDEPEEADLPFSQDVRDVLGQAERTVNDRSPELRKIGVGDILKAIAEPELYSRVKPMLFGSSSPSLSEIAQDLRRIEYGIAEVRNGAGTAGFASAINQIQTVLDGHVSKLDDVVSTAVPSRPAFGVHAIFSETGLASLPGDDTIKLRNLASALEEIRGGSKKHESRIRALEALCLKVMALAGVSALAALLLLGVVGYKSLA